MMREFDSLKFGKFKSALLAALLVASSGLFLLPIPVLAQSAAPSSAPQAVETEAETLPLKITTRQGEFEFQVELADEPRERRKGLMFRESMPPRHGMLFDFGETRQIQMWMRNTPLSLDMVFILPSGEVAHIAERTTPFSEAIIDSTVPISHVLEVNAGISKMIGLKVGDMVALP